MRGYVVFPAHADDGIHDLPVPRDYNLILLDLVLYGLITAAFRRVIRPEVAENPLTRILSNLPLVVTNVPLTDDFL